MNAKEHDNPALEALLKEVSGAFAPAEGLKESMRLRIVSAGDQPVSEESSATPQPAIRPVREVSYGPAERAQQGALQGPGRRRPGSSVMRRMAIPGSALAAAVAIAVVAYHFVGPRGGGVAFAEVIAAMQKVPWARVTGTWQHGEAPPSPAEEWMGFEMQVAARKEGSGAIEYKDYRKAEQWRYDPATKQLTVSRLRVSNEPFALGATDPRQFLDRLIEAEKSGGAKLTVRQDTRDGREVTVFTLDRSEKDLREHVDVFVDARTNLLVAVESKSVDADGLPVFHFSGQVDYPASGPASVHDLGVPADAVVVNQRPDPQVEQVLDRYNEAIKGFHRRFIAIRTVARVDQPGPVDYAYITYVDGERYRLEVRRSALFPEDSAPGTLGSAESFASLLGRWTSSPHSQLIGVTIDDGQDTYNIDCETSAEPRDPPGKSRHTGFLGSSLGWPSIDRDRASIMPDEYSRQNGLIRIELKEYVYQGKVVIPPYVFYLDPQKDYNCHRMEWTSSHGKRNVMEVREYARTPAGRWYPRVEVRRGRLPDADDWTELLHTIHLSTEAAIPAGAFDASGFLQGQTP